ncbi:MAG: glycosyltransferase family 4 protein, partial [Ignavibacteria bacterium]|nr:glycosyltransferase family 4 protein [Ignavibacteria bacterium]
FVENRFQDASSDIRFRTWEESKFLSGTINYIFSFYNYRQLLKFLRTKRIDVIHIQGFFSSLSPSILLAIKKVKLKSKIKVIQTLHEFHLICPNSSLFNFTKNEICEKCIGKKYKIKIFFENCDRRGRIHSIIKGLRSFVSNNILSHKDIVDIFITPSNFLREKLIEDGISPTKIKYIINPLSIDFVDMNSPKENKICFVGRLSFEKNIPFLIKAFSKWKKEFPNNYKLLIIGDGSEKNKIYETIRGSEFKYDIEMKPFLEHSKLAQEIIKCRFLSLASICYENSPLTLIEAVALNIIPIAPGIGGMQESINSLLNVGKTYIPDKIDSWIECLNYLIDNYNLEMDKLLKAKNVLPSKLSVQNYYNSLNTIYH